jgi:hypothetical protein
VASMAWDTVRFLRSSYSLNWSIRTEAIIVYTYKRPKHYKFKQIYTPGPSLHNTVFSTKSQNIYLKRCNSCAVKGSKHWENPLGKPCTCWILKVCYDDNRELLEVYNFRFVKCDCDFETRSAVMLLLNIVISWHGGAC